MATLTITVTAAQAARIATAFGHPRGLFDATWVPATVAEVQAWILGQVQRRTLNYEHELVVTADTVSRDAETW